MEPSEDRAKATPDILYNKWKEISEYDLVYISF
jgi:hypothetical protein